MQLEISREALLRPLQLVSGALGGRPTLPILGNVLLDVSNGLLSLTGTDLEVEMIGQVYLNSDPGSGPIFGWYMEENAAAKALFDQWLEPLKDLGARRNVAAKIGSTDHLAFTALGLPAFNSLQDYVEYDQREHHTNMDFADRVSVADLKQNAIMLASFAWLASRRSLASSLRRSDSY